MKWKFWRKSTSPKTERVIVVPSTLRYTEVAGEVVGELRQIIHSRFIDIGIQGISIIPPEDMP